MRIIRHIKRSFSLLALLGLAVPLPAQQFAIGARSDNDLFNVPADRRTDYEYTAGNFLWLEWAGEAATNGRYAGSCGAARASCMYRIRFEVGQQMYTPRIESADFAIPGQRPHAGLVSVRLQSSIDRGWWRPDLWIEVGAVGPIAFASETQQIVHELLDFREPIGWDRQLPNEPVLNIGGSITGRFSLEHTNGARIAIEPHGAFNAGTGNVDAAAGALLVLSIGRPGLLGTDPRGAGARVEAGSEYRFVVRDILLDGTLFSESPSVTPRHWVPRAFARLAVTFRRFEISYAAHWRGRSYTSEPDGHLFSTIELGYRPR